MRRLSIAVVVFLSTAALADLTMISEAVTGGKTRTVTLSARGSKAYFEMKEAEGPTRVMLRDGEAKKLYLVDPAKKTVVVITEQDSKDTEARQAAFRAQMQAQLAKMPPEQRKRVEATMLTQGAAPDGKPPVITWEKKKTPSRKVSGFSCEDYLIKRDGKLTGEACYASWKTVGITGDDFKETMLKSMPLGGSPMGQAFEAEASAPGFPVYRSHVDEQGTVVTESTVKSISKTAMPAETFEVPKGYTEKSMADAMGGPPRPPVK
jgi:hypothetical protein